jgi:hypothetical protein
MSLELALLVLAGGVILFLGVLFVYAVVSPSGRVRPSVPSPSRLGRSCVYCRSTHTRRLGQEPRYDDHGFALITSYECMRCGLPFWSVDRSPAQQRSH